MANNVAAATPNPLDQLRDIHLPEAISWWPMAPGWWILIIASCGFTAWLIRFFYLRYRASLYRRQALKQLKKLQPLDGSGNQQQLRDLFELLKQTANSAYPSHNPGSQSIEIFIRFLRSSCKTAVFDRLKLDMDKALYSNTSQSGDSYNHLFKDAKIWIKQHIPESKLEPSHPC